MLEARFIGSQPNKINCEKQPTSLTSSDRDCDSVIGSAKLVHSVHAECSLQVSGVSLKQVKKFKYFGVIFTSDGSQEEGLDVRSGKATAVMRALHHSVVLKQELSRKAKLLVFKSIFVPSFSYGHESWVMTDRVQLLMQASEMKFLQKIKRVTKSLV